MKRIALIVTLVLAGTVHQSPALAAQQSRAELIQAARAEPDVAEQLDLYFAAADPTSAALDSLWAVAVHELALSLMTIGESDAAEIWLRWSVREGAEWPIDRASLPGVVVDAYDRAVASVQAEGPATETVATTWQWADGFDLSAPGFVEVRPSGIPASVAIEGEASVPSGGRLEVETGTYSMVASASDYEEASFSREVLPGVGTMLTTDLTPLLPGSSEAAVAATLVSIRYQDAGSQVCRTGFMATPQGIVLTSLSALGRTSELEVVTPSGTISNVAVADSDDDLDLALLRLDLENQPVLDRTTGQGGDHVWSLFATGCQGTSTARTRLTAAPSATAIPLTDPLPTAARGGPLFDRDGLLLGTVVGPDRVIPMSAAERLLTRIVAEGPEGPTITPPEGEDDGGPPWVWIGVGAAVVGAAVALFAGGGGEEPTTGSIVVSFPGGAP